MKWIKARVLAALEGTNVLACYSLRKQGFLVETGWFESWKAKVAIDAAGHPIPWITYPCLAFLQHRVTRQMEVFEFGSGNSTLWWAARVAAVVSCEHDESWYKTMKSQVGPNVRLELRRLGEGYAAFVEQFRGRFQVIVIDGRDRVTCMKKSPVALAPDGVIILDNSERAEYRQGVEFLLAQGFRRLDFEGPGPVTTARWCTTVFYPPGNCLRL